MLASFYYLEPEIGLTSRGVNRDGVGTISCEVCGIVSAVSVLKNGFKWSFWVWIKAALANALFKISAEQRAKITENCDQKQKGRQPSSSGGIAKRIGFAL
jgi:hypothetical protein